MGNFSFKRMIGKFRDPLGNVRREIRREIGEARAQLEEIRSLVQTLTELISPEFSQRQQYLRNISRIGNSNSSDDPRQVYLAALNAMGVLNYENDVISGERSFLRNFFRTYPSAVVFDVGANTGQYAELLRKLGPDCQIHSFEPHPCSFAQLQLKSEQLGVYAYGFALGDQLSDVEFHDYADEEGSQHASIYRGVIEDIHRRPSTMHVVRCETLDALMPRIGVARIELLKIDTEGHELAVLKGAQQLIESNVIDVIQFEFNSMNVVSRVFMKDFFELLPNYRFYRLARDGVIEFPSYDPVFLEVFAYQNMACIRRDLDQSWIHGS